MFPGRYYSEKLIENAGVIYENWCFHAACHQWHPERA